MKACLIKKIKYKFYLCCNFFLIIGYRLGNIKWESNQEKKKNLQIRTTRFKIARFNLSLLSFLSYNLERQSMKNALAHH